MPRKKNAGRNPKSDQSVCVTGCRAGLPGVDGTVNRWYAVASPVVNLTPDRASDKQRETFEYVQDIVDGKLDADVIYMLLSECDWTVDEKLFEQLFELINDNQVDETSDTNSNQFNLKSLADSLLLGTSLPQDTNVASEDSCPVEGRNSLSAHPVDHCDHASAAGAISDGDVCHSGDVMALQTIDRTQLCCSGEPGIGSDQEKQCSHADAGSASASLKETAFYKDAKTQQVRHKVNSKTAANASLLSSSNWYSLNCSERAYNNFYGRRTYGQSNISGGVEMQPGYYLESFSYDYPFSDYSRSSDVSQFPEFGPHTSSPKLSVWSNSSCVKSLLQNTEHMPPGHFQSKPVTLKPSVEEASINGTVLTEAQALSRMRRLTSSGKKVLVLMRGCPGSGKTTLARQIQLEGVVLSADDYFTDANGVYKFDVTLVPEAHLSTQKRAQNAMAMGYSPLIIDNTNIQAWHMLPYVAAARQYDYAVEVIEPNTAWRRKASQLAKRNVHGVRIQQIKKMLERYEYNITPEVLYSQLAASSAAKQSPSEMKEKSLTSMGTTPDIVESPKRSGKKKTSHPVKHAVKNIPENHSPGHVDGSDDPHCSPVAVDAVADSEAVADAHAVDASSTPQTESAAHTLSVMPVISTSELIGKQTVEMPDVPGNAEVGKMTEQSSHGITAPAEDHKDALTVAVDDDTLAVKNESCSNLPVICCPELLSVTDGDASTGSQELSAVASVSDDSSVIALSQTQPLQITLDGIDATEMFEANSLPEVETSIDFIQVHSDQMTLGRMLSVPVVECESEPVVEEHRVETVAGLDGEVENDGGGNSQHHEELSYADGELKNSESQTIDMTHCTDMVDVVSCDDGSEITKLDRSIYVEGNSHSGSDDLKDSRSEVGTVDDFNSTYLENAEYTACSSGVLTPQNDCHSIGSTDGHSLSASYEVNYWGLSENWENLDVSNNLASDEGDAGPESKDDEKSATSADLQDSYKDSSDSVPKPQRRRERVSRKSEREYLPIKNPDDWSDNFHWIESGSLYAFGISCDQESSVVSQSVTVSTTVSTMTEASDFRVLNDVINNRPLATGQCCSIYCATPRVICAEKHEAESQKIPFRSLLDKSCATSDIEEEFCSDSSKLEFLTSCFPTVSENDLSDILSKCRNDVVMAADLLLEGGYEYNEPQPDQHADFNDVKPDKDHNDESIPMVLDEGGTTAESGASGESKKKRTTLASYRVYHDSIKSKVSVIDEKSLERRMWRKRGLPGGCAKQEECREPIFTPVDLPVDTSQLTLILPPMLASQLVQLFGPVESGSSGLSVQLDMETARRIHSCWQATQQQTHCKQESLTVVPGPDVTKCEMASVSECTSSAKCHLCQMSHVVPKHVADVGNASEAHWLATKIKRRHLRDSYPNLNSTLVDEIFKDNGYSLEMTEQYIASCYELLAPPVNVMTEDAALMYEMELLNQAIEESSRDQAANAYDAASKMAPAVPSIEEQYETALSNILHHRRRQLECLQQADEAKRKSMPSVAVHYSHQAREHKRCMDENKLLAAELFVQQRSLVRSSLNPTVDLHGLNLTEAMHVLRTELSRCEEDIAKKPRPNFSLVIITGRGRHSHKGVCKLRPGVITFLQSNNYQFTESAPGVIRVRLQ